MRTLLIPVDTSENALRAVRYAATLAAEDSSLQCHLINVQEPFQTGLASYMNAEQIRRLQTADAQKVLQGAVQILDAAGLPCHPEWRIGPIASTIVDYAKEIAAECIVMGTRSMNTIASLALGSTASTVIHLAPMPVTVVK